MSTFKEHLISAGVTFVSMFFFTFTGVILAGGGVFSKEAIISAIVAALAAATRALFKVIYEVAGSVIKTSNDIGPIQ